jgi:hypothetical protein
LGPNKLVELSKGVPHRSELLDDLVSIVHQVDEVAAHLVLSSSPQSLLCLSSNFDVFRLRITIRLDVGDSIHALVALARNAAAAHLTFPILSSNKLDPSCTVAYISLASNAIATMTTPMLLVRDSPCDCRRLLLR